MAQGEIKIVVGADVGKATRELKKVGSSLAELTDKQRYFKDAAFGEKDVTKLRIYNAELKKVAVEMKSVQTVGTNSMGAIGSGATKAFSALRTISYILPGIGIAGLLSFAVEPLVNFTTKLFGISAAAKQVADNLSKFNEDAGKNYGKEAASLQVLKAAIEDTNTPMATRLQAIKDLRKEYPDYFKDITNEALLNGKAAAAYDLVANAILRKARATAAIAQIEKIEDAKLSIRLQNEKDVLAVNKELLSVKDKIVTRRGTGDLAGTQYTNSAEAQKVGIKLLYNQRREAAQAEINALNQEEQFYLNIAKEGSKELIQIQADKVKKLEDVFAKLNKVRPNLTWDEYLATDLGTKFFKPVETAVKKTFENKVIVAPVKIEFKPDPVALEKVKSDFEINLAPIAASIANTFTDALSNALTTGNLDGFFDKIFKSIGSGLKELGNYLVQAALQILIVKETITAYPELALAAGIALQVLGGVIQNSISKKKAFATGGLVGGIGNRDTVDALLTPGEFVMTKSAVQRIGIANLSALNNGSSRGTNIGGNVLGGTQQINGTLTAVIDGKQLRLVLNRADASLSRVG